MKQLDLTLPARRQREALLEAVLEVLTERGGTWISQAELGLEAFRRAGLEPQSFAASTRSRRVKEAIHELRVERRQLIGSGPQGYRLDADRAGLRRIVSQIRSEAEVVRAYDPALADKLSAWLDLAERAA